jgi:hypothetical protein
MAAQQNGLGIVVGIDPWTKNAVLEGDNDEANADWWTNKINLSAIAMGCWQAIEDEGLNERVVIVRAQAHLVADYFRDIDILEIDGNHSELSSCRDVSLYLPRVKAGGFVWMDDSDWPTTQKAVAMLDSACERVQQVGSSVLFKKP